MGKYILEFSDRNGGGLCEPYESDTPLPIPGVGERIFAWGQVQMDVRSRRFYYSENLVHVELFCDEVGNK